VTETAQGIVDAQDSYGRPVQLMGQLVCGAVMVRETIAPDLRVQVVLRPSGGGQLVADTYPDGLTRGLENLSSSTNLMLMGPGATLQVARVLENGELSQGVVDVGRQQGVSGALTRYMLDSEQIATTVGVSCSMHDEDDIEWAGGFLVQLLPEADEVALGPVTERLEALGDFSELFEATGAEPRALVDGLMGDIDFEILEESQPHFGCTCNEVRVLGALSTLGRAEIEEILERGEVLEVGCDYCGQEYEVEPERLRTLLDRT
jgi:molecular chaperone Hsp33